jgi:hypothetical protein
MSTVVKVRRRLRVPLVGLLAIGAISGCGAPAGSDRMAYRPVATVDQVMDGIVIPSSQAIFDAVVYENGQLTQAPRSDDEWFRLQMQALAVAEAGNLLMMPGRAKDSNDWPTFARAMVDAGEAAAHAAESQDIERLLRTGGELYRTCAACHEKFLTP